MKRFIRENPTLAFGLGLPLLIVLVFLLASEWPRVGAIPPKYEAVFAVNYANAGDGIHINVQNHKAHAVYIGPYRNYPAVKLYIFNPTSGATREIPINLPTTLTSQVCCDAKQPVKITPLSVPELEALTINTENIAPDGYEFVRYDTINYPYSHDLLGGLFFCCSSNYINSAVLRKGTYKVRVPETENSFGNTIHFIGWIIPQ